MQSALARPVSCEGVGLHSGAPVRMTLAPAPAGTGIVFERTDRAGGRIAAVYDRVVDTRLGTTIENTHGVRVSTIEHLMSAFAGLGIDNAVVELSAGEVPIMDGSAAPFVRMIEAAGVATLGVPRRALRVLRPVTLRDGEKLAVLTPAEESVVECEISFASSAIGRQHLQFSGGAAAYIELVAGARTFGFAHEIAHLRKAGLALGGSLENAVVVDGDSIVNPEGLRSSNEFVRHKVLDAIGDLALAGGPILGRFRSVRGGHDLNNRILRTLFANPSAFEWVDLDGTASRAVPAGLGHELPARAAAAAFA
ncbi:MAG: UDP-3-O-acyl-N-acetylglucosamine deacetylase [Alphaproteobacteria bacterium]|nr:UDP-3-O-acyl-N-acetylglucosamine deacetylase [Alphaproteobacteria bacterium]